jgi:hypothetical protein
VTNKCGDLGVEALQAEGLPKQANVFFADNGGLDAVSERLCLRKQ